MIKFHSVLALAAALVLSACYPPTTSHPIGSSAAQTQDAALVGTWKGTNDDGKPGYFHFLKADDGALTVLISETGSQAEDWNVITVTTVRLGGHSFMNARMLSSDGKLETEAPAGTVPVLYRIDARGQMTLAMMDEDAVKTAIKAGKLKGTIGDGTLGDATITADPAALDAFLQTPAGLALFDKPFFTMKKVE